MSKNRPREERVELYRNNFKGVKGWIIGSGPSLEHFDSSVIDSPMFALNLSILMSDYNSAMWICRDGRAMRKWLKSPGEKDLGEDRRNVGNLFTDHAGFTRTKDVGITENLVNTVVNSRRRFHTGETILVYALQVLDYLGFKEIILAGVDLCQPDGRLYAKEIEWQDHATLSARPAGFKRMRKQVSDISETLNAEVYTASSHTSDLFKSYG